MGQIAYKLKYRGFMNTAILGQEPHYLDLILKS